MRQNEASERWIKEGKAYKDQMNEWLDRYYLDHKRFAGRVPEDTRTNMAGYVLEQVIHYNREGKYEELRQLFPPDTVPLNLKGITECVSKVILLSANSLVANIGNWYEERRVYLINNNTFIPQDGMITFGTSWNKQFFAKVYADRIDITEGWHGAVIKILHKPESYGKDFRENYPGVTDGIGACTLGQLGIQQVVVFPSGQKIGLACEKGIFVIDETNAAFIQTESWDNLEAAGNFTFQLETPHIDVSPDERYVVAGSKNSNHLLMELIGDKWVNAAVVIARGAPPCYATFNYQCKDHGEINDGWQVLLCARDPGTSALALPLKSITPGLVLEGAGMFSIVHQVDGGNTILCATAHVWGYQLGCDDGTIWLKGLYGHWYGYLTVCTGAVMSLDFDYSTGTLAAASAHGQVIVYDSGNRFDGGRMVRDNENRHEKRPDDMALTNTAYKDVKRYLFLKGHQPMIW